MMTVKEKIKKFIPGFAISFYHFVLISLAAFFYGFAGLNKKIKIIGVTGTSGKSTVVEMISKILDKAGYKTAFISSLKFKIKEEEWENRLKMTMPGRFIVQRFLNRALKNGCQFAILEVTSEGIKQHRHRFINFDAAVFTNLSPEHIEAHRGFRNYRRTKLKLFKTARNKHIVNIDDNNSNYFLEAPAKEKWGYSIKGKSEKSKIKARIPELKLLEAEEIKETDKGLFFKIQKTEYNLHLFGEFNVYNSLAAIAVARAYGIDLKTSKKALEEIKGIPGRMEIVIDYPFRVIVDYAHTPEALKKVYQTLSNSKSDRSRAMICVLGACGGGRDKWKRPVLGRLAEKYCQHIIITNEDPYDEPPMDIIKEVASGVSSLKSKNLHLILNRREAIRKAIELAKPKDIVVITGKGSEPWMCVENGKKIPWDDRKISQEEFRKVKK